MTRQLPSRPNLGQLKNQAKSLLKEHRAAVPEALARVRENHPRWQDSSDAALASAQLKLADTQLVSANEYGFKNWPALKAHVLSQQTLAQQALVKTLGLEHWHRSTPRG